MNIATLSCSSCGAPIQVSTETEHLTCIYCGSALVVKREAGQVSLKLAEKVSQSIQETGIQTQSAIREGNFVTQAELKKLQISQELSSLDLQRSNLRSEIRSLERLKANRKVKREIKELKAQEMELVNRQKDLRALLAAATVSAAGAIAAQPPSSSTSSYASKTRTQLQIPDTYKPKEWSTTFWLGMFFGFLGVHRFYTGNIVIGVLQLFTLGGLGIWWILDLFWLTINAYRDKFGQTLSNYSSTFSRASRIGFIAFSVSYIISSSAIGVSQTAVLAAMILGGIAFFVAYFWSNIFKKRNKETAQFIELASDSQDQISAQVEEN